MEIYEAGTITAVNSVLQAPDYRPCSTFTIRATAETSSGPVDVAVKGIAGHRLVNEVAAAWVANKLQLPNVAKVFLVDDPRDMLQTPAGQPIGGGVDGKWLATKFSSLPTFSAPKDYVSWQTLTGTQDFQQLFVFDVLIANTDRVSRNILWSKSAVCVFDHDKAFCGKKWTADTLSQLSRKTPIGGLFETNICYADQNSRDAIDTLAKNWAGAIAAAEADDLDELVRLGAISGTDVDALKTFVVDRSANLCALVQEVVDRNRL